MTVNLLILRCQKSGQTDNDEVRFSAMVSALEKGGISAKYYPLYTEIQLLHTLSAGHVDIVFSADHSISGKGNERIGIHSLLDQLRIPYIGSNDESLQLVLSKSRLKNKWLEQGIPTPEFYIVKRRNSETEEIDALVEAKNYPYLLKPDCLGNSRGVTEASIVDDVSSLTIQLKETLENYGSVLVEKYLGNSADLREFTIAMIGNGTNRMYMPCEVTLKQKKARRIITTEDKDNHMTRATPVRDDLLRERLISFAREAFEVTGLRDYARLDVLLSNGELYAIEINGQPMIPDKWFEQCCSGSELDGIQYINAVVLAGIVRNIKDGNPKLKIPQEMANLLPETIYSRLTS